MKGFVHSFESFGAVDGPGVRFVVFFQGCPMRCLYCHNPDTWNVSGGTLTDTDEIIDRLMRNESFYRSGGITATGGEPMMQMAFLTELFKKAKDNGINTCLDTSGVAFNPDDTEAVDRLLELTDIVMLDIKHIDDAEHKKLTGYSNKNILAFARYLDKKCIKMWIRHVIVPGITTDKQELSMLGQFLAPFHNVEKIETLPYHSMAKHKYREMGIEYRLADTPDADKEQAEGAKKIIIENMKKAI